MTKKLGAVAALLLAAGSVAGAQTNTFVTGTPYTAPSITTANATAASMTGMMVSWQFDGSSIRTAAWGDLGGGYWGVTGMNGFRLRMDGSPGLTTFSENWELTNSSTQRLRFIQMNGAPGRTLFDCGWTGTACSPNAQVGGGNQIGTPRTDVGFSLLTSAGGTHTGTVFGTYLNSVGVGGNPDVGDIFESLVISFEGLMGAGATYFFRADTDNSPSDQDIPSPMPTVPEPSTYLLMGTGLVGLFSARRKLKA